MKVEQLQKCVKQISNQYFGKPFLHEATFNPRLRTTGGRYHLRTHNLDFNPKILESYGMEVFNSIRDYKIKAGMMQLVNVLSLRLDEVKYRYGKEYSPLDIF